MAEAPFLPIPRSVRPDRPDGEGYPGEGQERPSNVHPLPSSHAHQPDVRRHSRFIRWMKMLLPVFAVVLIGLVVTWPGLQHPTQFSMGFSDIELSGNEPPRMVSPRFTGIDTKSRPYSLTADDATQVGESPELISLQNPQADITVADGSWISLTAEGGVYSENTQILGLRGSVNLYHDAGYEFHTASADLDLSAGTASGGTPVVGQGPFGQVNAQGFLILNQGGKIIFTGETRLLILSTAFGGGS